MTLAIEETRDNSSKTPAIPDVLKNISGVRGENLLAALLPDLVASFSDIADYQIRFNAALEALEALQPRDANELMICIQIIALHRKGMDFMTRSQGSDKYASFATKLLRLHSEKVESLMKYRRKGQQVVHVEHVHINQRGQAVIGNLQGGGS